MWKIVQIFDGDYGCEELVPGEKPGISVTLENERGEQKYISVEDEWLVHLLAERLMITGDLMIRLVNQMRILK